MFRDRRSSLFLAAVLIGIAVCVVSVQAACETGCECMTKTDAEKLQYVTCGEKPQACSDDLSKTQKYCFRKPVTPAPVPVKCDDGCSCLDPAKATAAGYLYCDTPHAVCGYDAGQNPLYCFKKPEAVTFPSATCADGCSCMSPEKAAVAGYMFCNGKQVTCDKDTAGNVRYCYGKPVTEEKTTVVPVKTVLSTTTVKPASCAKGCSCLDAAMINKTGYRYCGGTRTLCGYDPTTRRPLNCFEKTVTKDVGEVSTVPTTFVSPKETGIRTEKITKEVTPQEGFFSGIFRMIFGWSSMAQDVPAPDLPPPAALASSDEDLAGMSQDAPADLEPPPGAARAPSEEDMAGMSQDAPADLEPPPGAARAPSEEGSACSWGETLCNDECVDILNSTIHCGACGNACSSDEVCQDGNCTSSPSLQNVDLQEMMQKQQKTPELLSAISKMLAGIRDTVLKKLK